MDGKEEIRVVEEEPSWTGGSLESLDVIDKVPDESVMPRTVNGTGHTGPSEFCATSI